MSIEFRACLNACGFCIFRTLIGAGGQAQYQGRVLVPTVSGADTQPRRCIDPPLTRPSSDQVCFAVEAVMLLWLH